MKHTHTWYDELAVALGHRGYVTLAEVRQAEAREARETAATAKWTYSRACGDYTTRVNGGRYLIMHEPNQATWQISAWPSGNGSESVVRRQSGIRTLSEAKGLALAQPCTRCGLASPLVLMTQVMPERPGQRTGPRPAFRCLDTQVCEAERTRLTQAGADQIPVLTLTNTVTGESGPFAVDPGSLRPDCPNSMIENLGG